MKYELVLYIATHREKSMKAVDVLRKVLETHFKNDYALTVVDVKKYPEEARQDNIFVTPTIVKRQPHPMKKVLGDLSDGEKILDGLEILGSA